MKSRLANIGLDRHKQDLTDRTGPNRRKQNDI